VAGRGVATPRAAPSHASRARPGTRCRGRMDETPRTVLSRCDPIPAPGPYSVTSTCCSCEASRPAKPTAFSRRASRNGGMSSAWRSSAPSGGRRRGADPRVAPKSHPRRGRPGVRTCYLAFVLLLSALWLAVVHALASLAPPAHLRGTGDGTSRVASVRLLVTKAASAPDRARPAMAPATGPRTPRPGDEELRPPAPQRSLGVDRTSNRGVPPQRSPAGLAAFPSADFPVLPASESPRAAHHVSHAVAARGGHLPYFPTAPPLQG
jgi:hypothetical protein